MKILTDSNKFWILSTHEDCLSMFLRIVAPASHLKISLLAMLSIGVLSFTSMDHRYSKQEVEACVREVFGSQADALVLKSNSGRLELITDFLNRVELRHAPELKGKKLPSFTKIGLNSKYNPSLQRDFIPDPDHFNPLKYKFPLNSNKTELYLVDNSDIVIIIHQKARQ